MLDQHSPVSSAPSADIFGPLEGGERILWRGRCGVAEYAFDRTASLPRWTLPETTEVLVTDCRVVYAYASDEHQLEITSGELRWLWPQYLRVQPGTQPDDRRGAATQVQLVCGCADGSFPALVFAGGDLSMIGDADRVANVLRQAIARFRVDNAERLGLSTPQARMLSRLLIGPEFSNYRGGKGQTVSLQGAIQVSPPAPTAAKPEPPHEPVPSYERVPSREPEPVRSGAAPPRLPDEGTRLMSFRPGIEQDATRAWAAARAEEMTQQAQPDRASRSAALAAKVADMVSQSAEAAPADAQPESDDEARWNANVEVPTLNLAERASAVRLSAARFAANSAGSRVVNRRSDHEPGVTTRRNG